MRSGWRWAGAPMPGWCGHGAGQAAVSAEFAVGREPSGRMRSCARPASPATARRSSCAGCCGADGRSRAFVNDEPASVGAAAPARRQPGRDPGPVRAARAVRPGESSRDARRLRRLGRRRGAGRGLAELARRAAARSRKRRGSLAASREEEDLLRHELAELDALTPEAGEEDRLSARRTLVAKCRAAGRNAQRSGRRARRRGGALAALARAPRRAERAPRARPRPARRARSPRPSAPPTRPTRRWPRSKPRRASLELDPRELEAGRGAAVCAARRRAQAPGRGRRSAAICARRSPRGSR